MMRLLVVTRERAADRRYGLGKSLMPVLDALGRAGVEWRYLSQEDAGARGWSTLQRLHGRLASPLARVFRGTQVDALLWGLLERLNMGRLAAKVALSEGYTHVHCHDPFIAAGLCLALAGRRRGIRWGVTEHGFGSYVQALHEDGARLGRRVTQILRAREAAVLQAADWVVSPTRASLRQLARDLGVPQIPPHWCAIPHPLPPLPGIDREAARKRLGWDAADEVVLSVGRLVPLKAFPAVVRAFAAVARPGSRLVVLGDGDAGALTSLADELGVRGQVEVSSTDDIWPYYAAADVYVSTSTTESFGMANLEAVAMGVPSVCTAVGGVAEVVGAAAVLIPVEDDRALAEALRRLLVSSSERERLSEAGRVLGQAWPSADQIAGEWLSVYGGERSTAVDRGGFSPGEAEPAKTEPPLFVGMARLEISGQVRVLVLAPHGDDESLGCGGTIAKLVAAGAHVAVVFVSDGRLGDPKGYCDGDEDVVQVRRAEARVATERLGVAESIFLDFPDGGLRPDDGALEDAVSEVLRRVRPTWIFAPSGVDAHRDHVAVAEAALRARARVCPDARFFAYETWTPVCANRIVDVTETFEIKRAALGAYALPLRYVDYVGAAEGLARYRAMQLEGGTGFAEAFLEIPFDGIRQGAGGEA